MLFGKFISYGLNTFAIERVKRTKKMPGESVVLLRPQTTSGKPKFHSWSQSCSVRIKRDPLVINPLRPNIDVSQTSHCIIKGVSVSEVMRIENMITQVQFY